MPARIRTTLAVGRYDSVDHFRQTAWQRKEEAGGKLAPGCGNVSTAARCFGLKHHNKPLPQVTALVDGETRKVALDTRASANFVSGRIARPHHGPTTTVQLASKGVTTTSPGLTYLHLTLAT